MPRLTTSRIRLGTTPGPYGSSEHQVERRLAANFAAGLAGYSPSDLDVLPPNRTLARYALSAALPPVLCSRFWTQPERSLRIED